MYPVGSFKDRILFDTAKVTSESVLAALTALQGCWKSSSILWMHLNEFPVLSALILGGWFSESEESLAQFCRQRNFSELLVRIEQPGQRWTRRRGGYNIPVKDAKDLAQALANEGMITILLEPASPYSDVFSLTSICEVDTGKLDIEVVGRGFDASDLLRADITPHERFEIRFDDRPRATWDRRRLQSRRTHLTDPESYRASVRKRLVKIGARLRNPSFPDEQMQPGTSVSALEDLVQEATRYLRESGQTALLDSSDRYEPIPPRLFDSFLTELLRLSKAVAESDVPWRTFSLAGSFLSEERLVIWDFFPPEEHDVRTLLKLAP